MKISCIIPTHNRGDYLKEALNSVICQTREPDEIIVVNNGEQRVDLVGLESESIKIFNIVPHAGASQARNFGASVAAGDYLAFLDDDDMWGKDYVLNVYNAIKNDLAIDCAVSALKKLSNNKVSKYKDPENNIKINNLLIRNPGFGGSNIVIRKKTFFEVGGFNTGLTTSEDKSLAIELIQHGKKIYVIPNNYSIAHVHDGVHLYDGITAFWGKRAFYERYKNLMNFKQKLRNLCIIYKHKHESGVRSAFFIYVFLVIINRVLKNI